MKHSELRQLIREEIEKTENNKLKEKLKKALDALKKSGKVTKEALLDFLEGFLKNIDD
jgi:hypothetical protein